MPLTIHSIWSLLVALIGVIIYFSTNSKWMKVGEIMFAMGLLATLLFMGSARITIGR